MQLSAVKPDFMHFVQPKSSVKLQIITLYSNLLETLSYTHSAGKLLCLSVITCKDEIEIVFNYSIFRRHFQLQGLILETCIFIKRVQNLTSLYGSRLQQ